MNPYPSFLARRRRDGHVARNVPAIALLGALLAGCTAEPGGDDLFTTLLEGPKTRIEKDSFLELSILEPLREGPAASPFAQLGAQGPRSLWEVRRALLAAAGDSRIVGLKLEIEGPRMGFGALEELGSLLDTFRDSGKPVHVFLRNDFIDDGGYMLALAGDRIVVAPTTILMINGLRAEVTFWRGTFEKLGIVPHVIMFKEYKSAGEPFARNSMSEAFRESLEGLIRDLEERLVRRVSERRGLPPVQVRAGLALGLMTTAEAVQTGWVDERGYRDSVEVGLARAAKVDVYKGIELKKYLRGVDRETKRAGGALGGLLGTSKPKLAVLFAEGPIVAAERGDPFENLLGGAAVIRGLVVAKAVDEAADDDEVGAIVMRVDSPGGSAVGSDHIYDAIRRARQRGKPVVVSMASAAASGGYWISMGADRIVAQPSTLTGSIGVVMTQFDLRGFYALIGANVETVSISPGAGIMSTVEDFDGQRRERWTAWMTSVYEEFKQQVAAGRQIPVEKVEQLAKGRVWTGVAAKANGLVDELGGLSQAIALACQLGKLGEPDSVEMEVYPKTNLMKELFGDLFGDTSARLEAGAPPGLERWVDPGFLRELARPRVLALAPQITLE